MSTETSTATAAKKTKYVTLRIPKLRIPKNDINRHQKPHAQDAQVQDPQEHGRWRLSLRGRVVLARLVRVGPISAKKLAEEHLGSLLRRERGLAEALEELQELGLAKRDSDGWSAVEPTGDLRDKFHWQKNARGAWYNCYQYTTIYLPQKSPWRKPNALELWCVYWMKRLTLHRTGKCSLGTVARSLGITRKTARRAEKTLIALGHMAVEADGRFKFAKITDLMTYQGKDHADPEDDTTLASLLRELGIRDPDKIIEQGEAIGLLGLDLLSFAKRLHKRHDAGKWGEDPCRMILAAMKNRKNHRARGGVR